MNLVKWDPVREWEDISNSMARLFGSPMLRQGGVGLLNEGDWSPRVDISETETSYVVKADIPGVKKEDVKVTIEGGLLTISGERRQEKEEKGKKFHRIERSYGSFLRSFHLADDADASAVKAEFKDGILNVTVNKLAKAKAKAKEIAVS